LFRVRNSQSSRVKMSFVTAAMEKRARRRLQRASMSAVLPEPTGLNESASTHTHLMSIYNNGKLHPSCDCKHVFREYACLPSNAYGKRPVFPVSVLNDWHLAPEEASRTIQYLMGVSVVRSGIFMRVRRTIMRVTVRHGVWHNSQRGVLSPVADLVVNELDR
jgi:hypothetical protein